MATHHSSMNDWAHEAIQHDKRRPMMLGVAALAGVAIVILLMLFAITQMAGAW